MYELSHNVLVVDDEKQNIELASIILKKEGYKLYFAHDGESAFKIIKEKHLDVIVLDLMLGTISGFDILQDLKSNPRTSAVKVIVVSALNDHASIEKAQELGADGYISKPYDIISLKSTVKELLRASHISNFDVDGYLHNFFNEIRLDERARKNLCTDFLQEDELDLIPLHVRLEFLVDFSRRTEDLMSFKLEGSHTYKILQNAMNKLVVKKYSKVTALEYRDLFRSKHFFMN